MNHMWNFMLTYFLFYFLLKNEYIKYAQNVQLNNLSQGEHQTSITQVKTRKLQKAPFVLSQSLVHLASKKPLLQHIMIMFLLFWHHQILARKWVKRASYILFVRVQTFTANLKSVWHHLLNVKICICNDFSLKHIPNKNECIHVYCSYSKHTTV